MSSNNLRFSDMNDVVDCIVWMGWKTPADIEDYFKTCKENGTTRVYWRLSEVGTFVHHTRLERSTRDIADRLPGRVEPPVLARDYDCLALGVEFAHKYGVELWAWITMFDEGWFPRFKFTADAIKAYYESEGWELRTRDDDLVMKPGIASLPKWFENPSEEEIDKYSKVICEMEMSRSLSPDDVWLYYTAFAKEHPEFLRTSRSGFKMGRSLSYAYQEVRDYRIELMQEIQEYGVDGLLMDFCRWPTEGNNPMNDKEGVSLLGYDEPAVVSFREKYGQDPYSLPNSDPRWVQHRADVSVTQFLREVRQQMPGLQVGAMVYLADNLPKVFLDVDGWVDQKLVDLVLPYNLPFFFGELIFDINNPFYVQRYGHSSYSDWAAAWQSRLGNRVPLDMIVLMQIYDPAPYHTWGERLTTDSEFYSMFGDFDSLGIQGVSFYETAHIYPLLRRAIKLYRECEPFVPAGIDFDDIGTALTVKEEDGHLRLNVMVSEPSFYVDTVRWTVDGKEAKIVGIAPMKLGMDFGDMLVDDPGTLLLDACRFEAGKHTVTVDFYMMDYCLQRSWAMVRDRDGSVALTPIL